MKAGKRIEAGLKTRRDPPGRGQRVAFAFTDKLAYPPIIHNLKTYYVTQEMKNRGVRVDWVELGGREREWTKDGIRFSVLRDLMKSHLTDTLRVIRLALFCVVRRIQLIYLDEWLFLRNRPRARLAGQMVLRCLGVKVVLDQRDPYVDFEVASGELKRGTDKFRELSRLKSLLLRQTDLVILPSRSYALLYQSEGFPERKVFGIFRGIDSEKFNARPSPSDLRSRLGLEGKYVIGWFGLMHSYRMIKETIVPLIENLAKEIPGAHVLIGGEGPLLSEFERLQSGDAHGSFTLFGAIPYSRLPEYIAACDATICPVDPRFRFTNHSNWLKIAESISMGIPIVATSTEGSSLDYKDVRGIVWVGSDYQGFIRGLREVHSTPAISREAEEQAKHFEAYSTSQTIPRIVDRVLSLV